MTFLIHFSPDRQTGSSKMCVECRKPPATTPKYKQYFLRFSFFFTSFPVFFFFFSARSTLLSACCGSGSCAAVACVRVCEKRLCVFGGENVLPQKVTRVEHRIKCRHKTHIGPMFESDNLTEFLLLVSSKRVNHSMRSGVAVF